MSCQRRGYSFPRLQVQQLASTARVLAPGVYVFSKRTEHILIRKDKFANQLTRRSSCKGMNTEKHLLLKGYRKHRKPTSLNCKERALKKAAQILYEDYRKPPSYSEALPKR